nr:BapA/Bap/LapF family large adhesin [Ignatzschineria rhizosphaerae]
MTVPDAPKDLDVHQDGTKVIGTGEANADVTVKDADGNVVGTGTVDKDGSFTVEFNKGKIFTNGELLEVTLTNKAGTSEPGMVNAKDTTPPDAPTDLEFSEDGSVVTGKAEPNSKVTVRDSNGDEIGSATANKDGNFTVDLNPALVNGEEVIVVATDAANNESPEAKINAPDITAPDAPEAEIDDSNTVLTVKTESHATVKVYDSEGKPLLDKNGKVIEVKADGEGNVTYTFDPALERGKIINITATDAAGNESDPTKLIAGVAEILATTDNYVDLKVDATPTERPNPKPGDLNKGGFVVASVGLGPVLGLDVLADVLKKSVILDVEAGTEREVTVHGVSGGVQVLGTMDLYAYKLNESTGEWEQQFVNKNWLVAVLLGGRSKDTDFTLTEGKWMFTMASGEGVQALTGFDLKFSKDVVLDYAAAKDVSGSAEGNMITDEDAKYGRDEVPEGSTVTAIQDGNGKWFLPSDNGEIVADGKYGVLVVKADGSYTYTVNDSFRDFGEKDKFTYQVTSPSGKTSESDLTFELNITPKEDRIDVDSTVVLNSEPTITHDGKSDIKAGVGFSVLKLGLLGPVLGADLLGGKEAMSFNVGENQVKELTFHGSAGGIAVGTKYNLFIYKLDPETGNYIQVHSEKDWFTAYLVLGISDKLTLQFGEGQYKAMIHSEGGVSLLTGSGLYVDNEKVYDYGNPSKIEGQVSGDVTPEDSTIVLKAGDKDVEPGKETVVEGKYGKLVINSDGTYTYTVEKPVNAPADWKPPYGKVDTFKVVTQDIYGKTIIETLNIKVGTHTAGDDFNDVVVNEQNIERVETVVEHKDKIGNYGKSVTETFEVKEGQIAKDFIINVKGSSESFIGLGKKEMTISYVLKNDDTGKVVSTFTTDPRKDASLSHKFENLPAGKYTLEVTSSKDGNIESIDAKTTIVHLDEYTHSALDPVTGLLLDNDTGWKMIDSLSIANKVVYLGKENNDKGAKEITIEGQYGTLLVKKDGSYTYTPKGGVYGIDKFIYETTSKVGTKETAVLEINVGKNIVASQYDDIAISSGADDTFTMGAGADTVIFTNLGDDRGGNGGNGFNKWTDFNVQEGDKIDLTQLLDGNQTIDNITDYLKYEEGVLFVDRNGNGEFEELLEVAADSFDSLLKGINWEVQDVAAQNASIDLSNVESFVMDDAETAEPLALTLEDVILTDENDEVPFFMDSEEVVESLLTNSSDQVLVDSSVFDVQPVVDPLDDLLDQKTSLI